jgi:hypothetical protein
MKIQGIFCLKCGDTIISIHRHDYRHCKCGAAFVDGGRDYLRYGANDMNQIKIVTVNVDKDFNAIKDKKATPKRRTTKKSTQY